MLPATRITECSFAIALVVDKHSFDEMAVLGAAFLSGSLLEIQ